MTITHQTVLGEDGEPTAAIIPWDEFQWLVEAHGRDLDDDERKELREALSDSRTGRNDAFVSADEV